jgi:hypothetical protein
MVIFGWSHGRSGRGGEEKNTCFCRDRTPVIQSISHSKWLRYPGSSNTRNVFETFNHWKTTLQKLYKRQAASYVVPINKKNEEIRQ